ncbi:MAG: hypothetical protein HYR94_01150 [Chloroflexi bacterium]|nr:hypothetical protein [Chloroflexota bacterium]
MTLTTLWIGSINVQGMKTHILEQVNIFRGQREPEDDMTVVVAQRKELPAHAA